MSVRGRERLEECNRTRQRVGWKRWKWKFERIEGGFWTGLRGGAFQGNGEFHRVTVETELRATFCIFLWVKRKLFQVEKGVVFFVN